MYDKKAKHCPQCGYFIQTMDIYCSCCGGKFRAIRNRWKAKKQRLRDERLERKLVMERT